MFCFLIGHKLTSNEARKIGLVTDFDPKGKISEVRVHNNGCRSIAKCSQISCRNDTGGFRSWPPATCKLSTRRSFDHHGKGSGNFVQKKSFEKWKKVVSLIDPKVMKTRNDQEMPVTVSSVRTWFYMQAYVKKSSAGSTQLPTSRHLLSPLQWPRWHTSNKIASRVEPRRPPRTDVNIETIFRLDQLKHFQNISKTSNHLLRSEVSWCDQTTAILLTPFCTCVLPFKTLSFISGN